MATHEAAKAETSASNPDTESRRPGACDRSNLARACARYETASEYADGGAGALALSTRLDALHEHRRSPSAPLLALGAVIRQLRVERGLSTRELARRSTLARSTITCFEAGQLHPRRSALVVLAAGLDPDHSAEILSQLIAAAGDQMAPDTGGWQRYRRRRIRRALVAGTIPVPGQLKEAAVVAFPTDAVMILTAGMDIS
jgi:transcriptional regulator with XRE-family HTH domain